MPPPGSKTAYAVLGMLASGPRSGYDIRKEVEQLLGHFWHESYGQIYPVLHRLQEEGLIRSRTLPQKGRPDRNEYSITADGLAELQEWLARPVDRTPPRNELLLKVFFGEHSDPATVRALIVHYREELQVALERLRNTIAEMDAAVGADPAHAYWRLTAELGIRSMQAVSEWCDDAIGTLKKMERE